MSYVGKIMSDVIQIMSDLFLRLQYVVFQKVTKKWVFKAKFLDSGVLRGFGGIRRLVGNLLGI